MSATEVIQKVNEMSVQIEFFSRISKQLGEQQGESANVVKEYTDTMLKLAASTEGGAAIADTYNDAVYEGTMSMSQATAAAKERLLEESKLSAASAVSTAAQNSLAQATISVADAHRVYTKELYEKMLGNLLMQKLHFNLLNQTEAQIYSVALAAANGTMSLTEAMRILEVQFGYTAIEAKNLINILGALQQAKAMEAAGLKQMPNLEPMLFIKNHMIKQ